MENINKKAKNSPQFKQVADFLFQIMDGTTGEISSEFRYLCRDPWSNKLLPAKLSNISTTLFVALFPAMKSTSCERHLRTFKAWYAEVKVEIDQAKTN